MKTLQKILSTIAFLMMCLFSAQAFAQNAQGDGDGSGKGRGGNGEKREEMKKKMEEIDAKMNLTPEQAAKIKEIRQRYTNEAKGKAMALPEDAPREDRMKIMKDAMVNADTEIMELLTTEQQQIYNAEKEKLKEAQMEKRKEMRGKRKGK